jgi:hypothetical protein
MDLTGDRAWDLPFLPPSAIITLTGGCVLGIFNANLIFFVFTAKGVFEINVPHSSAMESNHIPPSPSSSRAGLFMVGFGRGFGLGLGSSVDPTPSVSPSVCPIGASVIIMYVPHSCDQKYSHIPPSPSSTGLGLFIAGFGRAFGLGLGSSLDPTPSVSPSARPIGASVMFIHLIHHVRHSATYCHRHHLLGQLSSW